MHYFGQCKWLAIISHLEHFSDEFAWQNAVHTIPIYLKYLKFKLHHERKTSINVNISKIDLNRLENQLEAIWISRLPKSEILIYAY